MSESELFFMQEAARHALTLPPLRGAQFLEGLVASVPQNDPKRKVFQSAFIQLAAGADLLERIANGEACV